MPFISKSCRRHRGDGSVRRPDNLVSFALRLADHGAWPAADSLVWRHIASDRTMDRKSAHGSMRLGTGSPLSDPRSGRGLWRALRPKTSINGHSRSTDVATFPMAKRICRATHRFDPTGVPRPCCCVRRAASPSHTAVVHEILQRGPYASILGEGYAGLARRRADRAHSLPPSSRRAAPPIYPDLIYDRHSP